MSNKFLDLIKANASASDPEVLVTNAEQPFKLSLEDMASELSINPSEFLNTTDLTNMNVGQPVRVNKSFLMQRYTLLATPLFNVYIQGVLPVGENTSISFFLSHAVLKVNGHPLFKHSPELAESLVERGRNLLPNFYSPSSRDSHIELIADIAKYVTINKDKCLSKANAEASIKSYLEDLADFLVTEGFASPKDWIQKNKPNSNLLVLTHEDIMGLKNSSFDF